MLLPFLLESASCFVLYFLNRLSWGGGRGFYPRVILSTLLIKVMLAVVTSRSFSDPVLWSRVSCSYSSPEWVFLVVGGFLLLGRKVIQGSRLFPSYDSTIPAGRRRSVERAHPDQDITSHPHFSGKS